MWGPYVPKRSVDRIQWSMDLNGKNSTYVFTNLYLDFSTYIECECRQQSAVPVTITNRNQHYYYTLLPLQLTSGIGTLL